MTKAAGKIFVSYRRDDSSPYATSIAQGLARFFGDDNVFIDLDLKIGTSFPEELAKYLNECVALIAVVGPGWLSPRLDDPSDWVRLEVGEALSRGITVVPVLVGGGQLPKPDQLPLPLQKLLNYQALTFTQNGFGRELASLVRDLRPILYPRRSAFWYVGRLLRNLVLVVWVLFISIMGIVFLWSMFELGQMAGVVPLPPLKASPPHAPAEIWEREDGEKRWIIARPSQASESGLQIVDVGVNADGDVDIKLKNSGNDSAFVTAIIFKFSKGSYGGCATRNSCAMEPTAGTLYDFRIKALSHDGDVIITPAGPNMLSIAHQVHTSPLSSGHGALI